MALSDETSAFLNEPEIQALDPLRKREAMRQYMAKKTPEFASLPPDQQGQAAEQVISRLSAQAAPAPEAPGWGRTIVEALVPPVGAYRRGMESRSPEEVRPLTRQLVGLASGMGAASEAYRGVGAPDPVDEILSTPGARAVAEAARETLQLGAEFGVGGAIGRAFSAGRTGATALRTAMTEGAAPEAIQSAARIATREALVNRFKRAGAEGFGVGAVHELIRGVEEQRVPAISEVLTTAGGMAAIGVGLVGAGAMISKYGMTPNRVQVASSLIQSDPELASISQGATAFVKNLERATGFNAADTADLAWRAARGQLDPQDQMFLRQAFERRPELLDTEFGLHVLRQQRSAFSPRFTTQDGPLTVSYEVGGVKIHDQILKSETDAKKLDELLKSGKATLLSARGRPKDLARYDSTIIPPAPDVPITGPDLDIAVAPEPAAFDDLADLDMSKPPPPVESAADTLMREQLSSAPDPTLWDELRSVDNQLDMALRVPRGRTPHSFLPDPTEIESPTPGALGEERVPLSARGEEIEATRDTFTRGSIRTPVEGDLAALTAAADRMGRTGKLGRVYDPAKYERPEGIAAFDAEMRARGARVGYLPPGKGPAAAKNGSKVNVIGNRDPLGVTITFQGDPTRTGAISPTAPFTAILEPDGGIRIPKFATEITQAPVMKRTAQGALRETGKKREVATLNLGETILTPEETAAYTDKLRNGETILLQTPDREFVKVTPHLKSGTVTVNMPVEESSRASLAQVTSMVLSGKLTPAQYAKLDTDKLVASFVAIRRSMAQTLERTKNLDDAVELAARSAEVELELARRMGTLGKGLDQMERPIFERFFEILKSERGSLAGDQTLPQGVRLTPLANDSPIQALARVLDGSAEIAPDGRVAVRFGDGILNVYEGPEAAFAGLQRVVELRRLETELFRVAETQAKSGVLRAPQRGLDPEAFMDPSVRVSGRLASIDQLERYVTGRAPARFLLPVNTSLRRLGSTGEALADRFALKNDLFDRMFGKALVAAERQFDRLTPEESASIFYPFIEGKLPPGVRVSPERAATMRDVHQNLLQIFNNQYLTAKALRLDVAKLEQNYLPHHWDVGMLRSDEVTEEIIKSLKATRGLDREAALDLLERTGYGTSRGRLIRSIVRDAKATGKDMTEAEAAKLLDTRIRKFADRKSGNLERERIGTDGYITDARKAITIALASNAKRIAEVRAFGLKDADANALINRLYEEGGEPARAFAQRVFDLETGVGTEPMSAVAQSLYNWQAAKLSLAVIANSTQSLNTLMLTDLRSLAKGLGFVAGKVATEGKFFRGRPGSGEFFNPLHGVRRYAHEIGAITHDMLAEYRTGSAPEILESALRTKWERFVGKPIEKFSLAVFNGVEAGNRAVAAKAGEVYFDGLIRSLRTNPDNKRTLARLKELGTDAKYALRASPEDLAEMRALAGLRMANLSQFRSNVQNLPLARQSDLGRFVYQFKTFALNQAKLITGEVAHLTKKNGDRRRGLRALALLTTAYPAAGMAISMGRSSLFGSTLTSDVINEAIEDPEGGPLLAAYFAAMVSGGSLGIISDLASTAALGNKFALTSFFVAPSMSTAINALDIGASVVRGSFAQDPEEFGRAAKTFSREFGGLGAGVSETVLGEDF